MHTTPHIIRKYRSLGSGVGRTMNSKDDKENYDDDDNDHGDDMNGEVEYEDHLHPSCCSVKDKVMCSLKAWECDKALTVSV